MLSRWNDPSFWTSAFFDRADVDRTFAVMDDLRRGFAEAFADFERDFVPSALASPRARLTDEGKTLRLVAALPGLTEKDVQLSLHQDVLTVTGERKADAPEGYTVHRKERPTFKFARSFELSSRVDPEKVSATLKDGVLVVELTKVPEAQPRQITVKAN
jgi:HSP20 family protein